MKKTVSILLVILLLLPFRALSNAQQADGDISSECSYTFSKGGDYTERMTDQNVMSRLTLSEGSYIEVSLSKGGAWLFFEWYELPAEYAVYEYDAQGNALLEYSLDGTEYFQSIKLNDQTFSVRIRAREKCCISTLRVFEFEPSVFTFSEGAKADSVLLIPQAAELFESFSALLPYLMNEGGQSVYIVCCNSQRRNEAQDLLEAVRDLNLENQPIFLHLTDSEYNEYDNVASKWGEQKTREAILQVLSSLQPETLFIAGRDESDARTGFLYDAVSYLISEGAIDCTVYSVEEGGQLSLDVSGHLPAAIQSYKLMDSRRVFRFELENRLSLSLLNEPAGGAAALPSPS
ncbi:MAG: hypothetical protein Q4C01_07525, partial [Clostridia bacterium]|nr:hypothetical protein [Clostridia bacterium]